MPEPGARASKRDAFIAEPRTAVFSTVDARGRSHAVPVWYLWKDGEFHIVTERESQKHRNAARSGRAGLTVVDGPRYLTAEGPVRVVDPLLYEERLALHTHYRGAEAAAKSTADGAHTANGAAGADAGAVVGAEVTEAEVTSRVVLSSA